MLFRFLSIAFFILLGQNIFAQDPVLIRGRIVDKVTGTAISDVNIKLKDLPVGTTTSNEGTFRILVKELPVILEISHIGFLPKLIEIKQYTEEQIIISLEPTSKELKEVMVSGRKVETIYKHDDYSVLDYEFLGDDILMLVNRNSFSRELILLNTADDTIAKLNTTRFKPRQLFKDCLGNIHVLCNDTAYQLGALDKGIDLFYPAPMDEFVKMIYPCIDLLGDKLYIKFYLYNNLVLEYDYVKEGENKLHVLRQIIDSEKTDLINSNPYIQTLLNMNYFGGLEDRVLNLGSAMAMAYQIKMLGELRTSQFEAHYLSSIVLTPVFAPLLKVNDTIVIFNHPADQIEFYDSNDRLTRLVSIDYHNDRDWEKEIFLDEATNKVYCLFLHSGIYELKEINLLTGKPDHSTKIHYPFAKTIKVNDGYVYYLYKRAGEWENSKLFRQKLN
jgi:hypothetical protein